jgi:hypothetical protein
MQAFDLSVVREQWMLAIICLLPLAFTEYHQRRQGN